MIPRSAIIHSGHVLIYRVFDIADEIRLDEAERLIKANPEVPRIEVRPTRRSALVIRKPPVRASFGSTELRVGNFKLQAELSATIWDYGAVSMCFHVSVAGMSWSELERLAGALSEPGLGGLEERDLLARQKCDMLAQLILPSLTKPHRSDLMEDYVIYALSSVEGVEKAQDLVQNFDLAALLWGEESGKLAEKSRQDVLQYLLQYSEKDCVVIDWNSAIVFDSAGQDTIEVLEFALIHLFELRYYDDLADRRLADMYDAVETRREKIWTNSYRQIARDTSARYIEISEFIERVENSLKVVGDFYLATVFRNASRRFRIADWQDGVNRKLNTLARVAELLHDEINTRRSQLLELTIIALILFEIIQTMTR